MDGTAPRRGSRPGSARARQRTALTAIAAFCIAGVFFLTGLKAAQDVFIDAAEAYAWGQSFLGGYGRHPPMTGWIAGVWYSVFPAADWASYALSRVMTFVTLVALYFIARRVAGPRRALFVVLLMMLYPLFHTKGERFNNYQVLLALLPVLVLTFLIAYEKRNARGARARPRGRGLHADDLFRADRRRGDRACGAGPSGSHALPALARAVGRGGRVLRCADTAHPVARQMELPDPAMGELARARAGRSFCARSNISGIISR